MGRVLAVVGPTASGKSDLGVAIAQRAGGEVVNADALQLYRGMDIGTAKLPVEQRRGIAHYQLDVLDVTQEASVAAYQRGARADIAGIRARGAVPVLVGGSGLYVRAALDRLDIPPTDPSVRGRLEDELRERGSRALHKRLGQLDPPAAEAILAGNGRRVVRALEVVELTGEPFSATLPRRESVLPTAWVGLHASLAELDERIAARVERMWAAGLLDEVAVLADCGLREAKTASRAVGYAQALAHLDGHLTRAEAVTATVHATRRLARRQVSWFRADPRVTWLPYDAPDLLERALAVPPTTVPSDRAR